MSTPADQSPADPSIQAAAWLARHHEVLDDAPWGWLLLDTALRVHASNDRARALLESAPAPTSELAVHDLLAATVDPEDLQELEASLQTALTRGRAPPLTGLRHTADGHTSEWKIVRVHAEDGRPAGLLVMVRDTTTEHRLAQAEADAHRANEALERVARLASHDLKEPLRISASFIGLLERRYGPQLDDEAREYITFAIDAAKRMQGLVQQAYALAQGGLGEDEEGS